jgi:hypothetical protein
MILMRIASMPTESGRRTRELGEEPAVQGDHDYENDYDNDNEENMKPHRADVPGES